MVELSQLLGLFTGKLMEQQDQVEEIFEAAASANVNVEQVCTGCIMALESAGRRTRLLLVSLRVPHEKKMYEQANNELLTTLERNSKASQTMLTFVVCLCLGLLLLDQIVP